MARLSGVIMSSSLVFVLLFGQNLSISSWAIPVASAAEEASEDERSEDEGSEERSESGSNDEDEEETEETITRTYTVIEKVQQVVMVTPEAYLADRDGDLLVDALDPNPDTHQRQYFTDDDGDSVANAYDTFPGQDDLATFGSETDDNANGIIDRYES